MSHRRSQKHTNKHTSNVREAWTHATRLGAAPHGTQRRSDEEQHARSVPDEQSLGWVDADAAAEQVPAQAERQRGEEGQVHDGADELGVRAAGVDLPGDDERRGAGGEDPRGGGGRPAGDGEEGAEDQLREREQRRPHRGAVGHVLHGTHEPDRGAAHRRRRDHRCLLRLLCWLCCEKDRQKERQKRNEKRNDKQQ